MIGVLALLLHAVLVLGGAPLLAGLQARVGARVLGRAGPPLLQPWRDLRRLLRKEAVRAEASTGVSAVAPLVALASAGTAALLVPSFALGMATAPWSDLLVLGGLLAGGRFAMALAGYDAGTTQGGMAAGRIALAAVWGSPAALLAVLVLAMAGGSANLDAILAVLRETPRLPPVLAGVALAIVGLSAFDEPAPGFTGPDLAVVTYAGQVRAMVWLGLVAAVVVPSGIAAGGAGPLAWGIGVAAWVVKIVVLGVGVAVWAALTGGRVAPAMPGLAAIVALLAAAVLFAGQVVA